MGTKEYIYSVKDIAKKLDISRQSAMKRIEKSGVKGMVYARRRKKMFSEKEFMSIKSCAKCYATQKEIIYVTETYHIYESKLNSML